MSAPPLLPWPDVVRARMRAKTLRGTPTGPVPLGYVKVRERGRTSVEVDGSVAPLVREAFRLAGLKRPSLRKIAAALAGRGLLSRHGLPLSAPALRSILTNRFYVGLISYSGETMKGTHVPLVGQAAFQQAGLNLKARRRRD